VLAKLGANAVAASIALAPVLLEHTERMPVIIITQDREHSRPARRSSDGERRSASDSRALSGMASMLRRGEEDRVEVGDREMRGGDRMARHRKRVSSKRRHSRKRKVV
jgi:hypothetical protein